MPYVVGFYRDSRVDRLREHFGKHGFQFGQISASKYESMAIAFLEVELDDHSDIMECWNIDGDLVRFNPVTDEFGILQTNGVIRTYFKPMPEHLAPAGFPLKKTHPFATNLDYFEDNCETY